MSSVRPPAVAGLFYPDDPEELRALVLRFVGRADPASPLPRALIAPHAGYPYSGAVAGSAYAHLRAARARIRRVLLLGPAHRVPLSGLALPAAGELETPLGRVRVDAGAVARIARLPQISTSAAAHADEHSLEVHLPFLQVLLDEFAVVPLVAGRVEPAAVEEVLEILWQEEETLVLVSSDMSHYHDYETARRLDAETARRIEAMDEESLQPERACGCVCIQGLVRAARRRGLVARCLDLRNSGDASGPRHQVVGYGAYVFA